MKTTINKYQLWVIVGLFLAIGILHYIELIGIFGTQSPSSHFGLTRHTFDRILFLLPIIYSGITFGIIGGIVAFYVALFIMLPRSLFLSPSPLDSFLEMAGILITGLAICTWNWTRIKAGEKISATLKEIQSAHKILQHYVQVATDNERRLTILNSISTLLYGSLDLDTIVQKSVHMVSELMEVEVTLLFSLDETRKKLILLAYEGLSDEFARSLDGLPVGDGVYGSVAQTGKPVIIKDGASDPILQTGFQKMKLRIQLIVPLMLKGQANGVLCVAMRRPREFTQENIELLNAVGAQIANAIENAQLYKKEHHIAQQLAASEANYRRLFEDASDAILVHDLQGNITVVNKACEEMTGYSAAELAKLNAAVLLPAGSTDIARQVRYNLLQDLPFAQPYEQRLVKKDGSEIVLMLTTNLVMKDGKPVGFQNMARDVTRERLIHDNLRYYVKQIIKAQEDERKRIARDLHDDTAQVLYALTRQVDNFLRGTTGLGKDTSVFLKDLSEQIKKAQQDVRHFSQDLRPAMLDDLGLLPTLRWLITETRRRSGIDAELKVVGYEQRFSPYVELALFRIIQEALRNIEKHAQASKIEVELEYLEYDIRMSITDNGKGFQPPTELSDLPRKGMLGLAGMKERVNLLDGTLKINTAPGKGTSVVVELRNIKNE